MNKPISILTVLPKSKYPKEPELVFGNSVSVRNLTRFSDITHDMYHDAVIIHERHIDQLPTDGYDGIAIIVATDDLSNIARLYPKLYTYSVLTVIPLPLDHNNVQEALDLVAQRQKEETDRWLSGSEQGVSVGITSFANGVGKSLISYHLAQKISTMYPADSVALVDSNRPLSIAQAMIGSEVTYSWDTIRPLLAEGTIQPSQVVNVMNQTPYRFQLLSGPSGFENNLSLSRQEKQRLHTALRRVFRITIEDLPTADTDTSIENLLVHDHVVIIFDTTSISLLQTKRAISYMEENHPNILAKCIFVLNRCDEDTGRSASLVSTRFPMPLFGSIDQDADAIREIVENGALIQDNSLLINAQLTQLASDLIQLIRKQATQQSVQPGASQHSPGMPGTSEG